MISFAIEAGEANSSSPYYVDTPSVIDEAKNGVSHLPLK